MTKFLIKKTYTAINSNKYFQKGHKESWYIGKTVLDKELCDFIISDGYNNRRSAESKIKKDLEYHNIYQSDFWDVEYEIIEVYTNNSN